MYMYNKIYREQSIPVIALWCPAFSNHGLKHFSLLQLLFDHLLCLPFKESCRTLEIYFSLFSGRIASYQFQFLCYFLSGCLYTPRPLIYRVALNDVTSLTTYRTHTRVSDTNICIYIYVVRTRGKAIIGMALQAIVRQNNNYNYNNRKL